jgi:hypothetical protein
MSSIARGERLSFLHIVENPREGHADIYYCLPLPDGWEQHRRKFFRIPIDAPPWSPGERPFWVELATSPRPRGIPDQRSTCQASESSRFYSHYVQHPDVLILAVDREVTIGSTEPRRIVLHSHCGTQNLRPTVIHHRTQHRPQIPQTEDPDTSFLNAQRVATRRLARNATDPSGVGFRTPHHMRRRGTLDLVVLETPRPDGGISVRFIEHWESRSSGNRTTTNDRVIAVVDFELDSALEPAAWYYRISEHRVGSENRFRADFYYAARNLTVRTRIRHLNPFAGAARRLDLGVGIISNATTWTDVPHIDIRFKQLPFHAVKRADYVGSYPEYDRHLPRTEPFSSPFNIQNVHPQRLGSDVADRLLIDLTIGMIPVLGDVVDLGELVLALSTGRDRWGEEVTSAEIALMGLAAILPFVTSSSVRRLGREAQSRLSDANATLRRTWGSAENFLEHYRPGLLRHLRGSRRSLNALLEELRAGSRSSREAFLRATSAVTSMTGVRHPELARALDL